MYNLNNILDEQNRPCLIIDTQHGLGNRMRAIGSAAAVARETNRELIIVWVPDHHCNCEFTELFDYQGIVINEPVQSIASNYCTYYNYMEIEDDGEKGKEIDTIDDGNIYVRAGEVLNSEYSTWDSENIFLKQLKPVEQVQSLIDSVDVTNTIGVHVRMEAGKDLDHNTYDSPSNWSDESHRLLHEWREKSHYKFFIRRLNQIMKEKNNEVSIFLAADMASVYNVFKCEYKTSLKFLNRTLFTRCENSLKYALADTYLLSQCQLILGSTWSSFSEYACRLSNHDNHEFSGVDF